ncbi:MAG: cytidylate kinase-like family protein [Thiotrichales bacterium]|nr:MAG: cytidylate kinase-like family protein [Thiotrichales bacterium]
MRCNADRLIEGLITAQLHEQQAIARHKAQQSWDKSKTHVVTVSRNFGALGREVAQLLADTLEVRCCDRHILQEVARRADVDESLVKVLDEHISHIDSHWWESLLNKNTFSLEEYYKYLVKTVFSISLRGGVIIGRGANLILGPERAFRVRIVGSPDACARRVAERENIDIEDAKQKLLDVDRERAEYVRTLYQADINDPLSYDLVLNSDRYDRVEMVELILEAMQRSGYQLQHDVFDLVKKLA